MPAALFALTPPAILALGSPAAAGAPAGTRAARATNAATPSVKCPLAPAPGIPPGEAWAFTQTGAPSSPHPGLASSYTHGRGSWRGGHGSGTICMQDSLTGQAQRTLVLGVSGASELSAGITRIGHVGAQLVLGFAVSASDDAACPTGTRGTATLFASYYEGHYDIASFHFDGACASYAYTFRGPSLHVAIARDGHQL